VTILVHSVNWCSFNYECRMLRWSLVLIATKAKSLICLPTESSNTIEWQLIKTHSSVPCGPRSHHAALWVYWQEDKESNFYTYVALISLTPHPNQLLRSPQTRKIYQIWSKLYQPIQKYERARLQNNFLLLRLFANFKFSTIKCKCIPLSSWNLVLINSFLKHISIPISVGIR